MEKFQYRIRIMEEYKMRNQIDDLTTSLRSLMYRVEENSMSYSERNAIESASVYMNRAVESFEEFSKYIRAVVECLEGSRLNNVQEAAAAVYSEAYQVMQELDETKSKLSYIAYNS